MFCLTIEASIGRNRVVVAVLLEHSVNMATSKHSRMEMAKGGMLCSGMRLSPSQIESPDFCVQFGNTHMSVRTIVKCIIFQKVVTLMIKYITSLPCANAKPPPRSKRMFQGIFSWTTSQLSRAAGASEEAPVRTRRQGDKEVHL